MAATGLPLSEPPKGEATILPHEKVFPIQVGAQLFRLSGASIASDVSNIPRAPSYFSRFFEEQLESSREGTVRTLYIDRDPETFQEILRHLQGYYVRPKDGAHFVKLFADAQFYSLPRLIAQLFECEIFIQIGDRHFQIPRDIFSSPGDSPNFFSLGFAVFFASPSSVFPGLERGGLLRPPSITPPIVSSRSGDVFAELLHMLRGYPIHIRDEEHRECLLRDCRYYHLRGLEQRLIRYNVTYNLDRRQSEITLRLEDVRPSGVTFVPDASPFSEGTPTSSGGWVHYSRPFVDEKRYELIVEIGSESTLVDLATMRAELHGQAKSRVAGLCQAIANKMNLPTNTPLGLQLISGSTTPLSAGSDRIKVHIDASTDIMLDGEPFLLRPLDPTDYTPSTTTITTTTINPSNNHGASSSPSISVPADTTPMGYSEVINPLAHSGLYSRFQTPQPNQQLPRKRRRTDASDRGRPWIVNKGQWRLRVHPLGPTDPNAGRMEIIFVAVKLDVYSSQRGHNSRRGFIA